MGEILEVQREEHDRRAVRVLKSGTIVGSIVFDNSQLELSSVAFPLVIRGKDRSTGNNSNRHSFSPNRWR